MAVVGIDIGTQSLKAVVMDDGLALLGEASEPYQPSYPRPGWAEQDPGLWTDAVGRAIARALARAEARPGDVRAIGIGGQLDGSIPTDAAGQALGPALIWMDRRAVAEIVGVSPALVRERAGVVLDATHMAAKIRWQRRHDSAGRNAARFHQPVSYMVARLTGEHVFDHALASTTMLYGLGARGWDDDLLAAFDIDPRLLPRIAEAEARAGGLGADGADLTGLPSGTPVAVGTGDDFSNPIGAGAVLPGATVCTLGTAEVVGAVHGSPAIDARGLVETHGFVGGAYFIENPGWLSGGAVAWLRDMLGLSSDAAFDALAGEAPPGCDGVTFLPALSGAMAPEWNANARGCFYGLTPAHGAGHLARAVLEGTAFAMRDVIDRLGELGAPARSVLLLGGGARSRLWARVRADLMGLPMGLSQQTDASPVGGAVLGAVAAGLFPTIEDAARRVAAPAATIEPDPRNRGAIEAAYRRYLRLFESLKPLYEDAS